MTYCKRDTKMKEAMTRADNNIKEPTEASVSEILQTPQEHDMGKNSLLLNLKRHPMMTGAMFKRI